MANVFSWTVEEGYRGSDGTPLYIERCLVAKPRNLRAAYGQDSALFIKADIGTVVVSKTSSIAFSESVGGLASW